MSDELINNSGQTLKIINRDPETERLKIVTGYDVAKSKVELEALKAANSVVLELARSLMNERRADGKAQDHVLIELGELRAWKSWALKKLKKAKVKLSDYETEKESTETMFLEGLIGLGNAFTSPQGPPKQTAMVQALRQMPGITKEKALAYIDGIRAAILEW